MAVTRRRFVGALGATGATVFGTRAHAERVAQAPSAPTGATATGTPLIKLDQNENPNAPSARVTNAVMDALKLGHRYPRNLTDLVDALAKLHGVARENVLVAAGSGEL